MLSVSGLEECLEQLLTLYALDKDDHLSLSYAENVHETSSAIAI